MSEKQKSKSAHPLRIMVVEDDAIVRLFVADHLREKDFDVLEADDGDTALALMAEANVDLIFTDVVMPRMSGVTLARHVRETYPGTLVLLTSGYTNDNRVPEELPYIQKPYEPEEVEAAIIEMLGGRQAQT
jgi:DNA-binding response OmpR family regulator